MSVEHSGEIIKFTQGDRIISKGEAATRAYLIERGTVHVFIQEGTRKVKLADLGEGQIFGETAILSGGNLYGAHVEAAEDCELRIITPDYLGGLLENSDPVVRTLIKMLSERLKNTNEALVKSETREFMDIALI